MMSYNGVFLLFFPFCSQESQNFDVTGSSCVHFLSFHMLVFFVGVSYLLSPLVYTWLVV